MSIDESVVVGIDFFEDVGDLSWSERLVHDISSNYDNLTIAVGIISTKPRPIFNIDKNQWYLSFLLFLILCEGEIYWSLSFLEKVGFL